MTRVEVRCCCDPKRVLGTLPVHGDIRDGMTVNFSIASRLTIPLWMPMPPDEVLFRDEQIVSLKIGRVVDASCCLDVLALNSNETDPELLNQIPGFIPA